MTGDPSLHRLTWDQIPWIVNGTLPEAERSAAEAHLQSCADCRDELEFQQRLATSMERQDSEHADPQHSWRPLQARIEAAAAVPERRTAAWGKGSGRVEAPPVDHNRVLTAAPVQVHSFRWTPWLAAAMVVQALGLGALGSALWSRPVARSSASTAIYRTLSDAGTSVDVATIRVVFAPDTSVGRMQALLNEAGLQVRSGPSSAGVWSLEPAERTDRASTQSALTRLRGNPEVRFAEAVGRAP